MPCHIMSCDLIWSDLIYDEMTWQDRTWHAMARHDTTRHDTAPYQTKPNQTKPKPNQTKPYHTIPYHMTSLLCQPLYIFCTVYIALWSHISPRLMFSVVQTTWNKVYSILIVGYLCNVKISKLRWILVRHCLRRVLQNFLVIDLRSAQVYCVAIFLTCWHPSHFTISFLL